MVKSDIQRFFRNQTVFLTGGTGFLGKILLEKLLRKCKDLDKIYVLVRPKKGQTPQERFGSLFDLPCFKALKKERSGYEKQVVFVEGDCEKPDLGLSDEDKEMLRKETTCVIHAAAVVKFDHPLRTAAYINVRATRDVIKLAHEMPKLKVFVHVSTAWSHCPQPHIAEKFYEAPMSPESLLTIVDAVDEKTLESITPHLLGKWPNTYVYTKAVAEDCLRTNGKGLNVALVRPGIVTTSYKEPVPGWIDNFYGVVGIVVGASLGVLRSLNAKPENVAQLVPVDFVANNVLAAAWDVYEQRAENKVIFYNFVGTEKNPITWRSFVNVIESCAWDYPTEKCVWYYGFALRSNTLWHKICVFFLHTVQAHVVDFVLFCLGKPTLAVKNYARIDKLLNLITYFSLNSWQFDYDNVSRLWKKMSMTDRGFFNFDMESIDWAAYARESVAGGRVYLLKDPLDTIPKGKKKMRILRILHYTLVSVLWYCVFKVAAWFIRVSVWSRNL